ncbi:MAG: LamG domain-containing protein [Pedobacter sp.]|nr:MAG: LamG domain-containing protein [Pedobacter sp.]
MTKFNDIVNRDDLVCYWDFNEIDPYLSKGNQAYRLTAGNGDMVIRNDGPLSGSSVEIKEGQYLYIKRSECPELNIYGHSAQVTVMAWVKRMPKSYVQCEAIAGMWNETDKLRQYCLFLNLRLNDSADQVCGHISGLGGPTPNQKWCIDASIGATPVLYHEWNFVAFNYDGNSITSFLNGIPDLSPDTNPYEYQQGIFDGGTSGSDFTVGAVHRLGEMGNFFVGQLAGLAIYSKALSAEEILAIHQKTLM